MALKRCYANGLAKRDRHSGAPRVNTKSLCEFIVHGLRYVFPAKPGEVTRGIATGFAAPVLQDKLMSAGELVPVQALLLQQGAAVASGELDDSACRTLLLGAENMARKARAGFWSDPTAIKNPENPGDIMTRMGQFTVVEGRVLTVRSSGATVYVNFGRRWTQDFAVTISRQQVTALESVGLSPKALDKRWVRVRGFIGNRNGPQIAVRHVGQIEVIGDR